MMKLFSGSSNKPLAEKIAQHLNSPQFSLDVHIFPDGEQRLRVPQDVLDEDTILVQSAGVPTDQNYMQLFFGIDALKRSGAKSVTAVIPYLGYQRQDHVFREGEARSLEVIGSILKTVGVDKVIAGDLHSVKTPEIFKIPFVEVSALPLFAQKIRQLQTDYGLETTVDQDCVLVSPDMGGVRRIKKMSELLGGMPFVTIEKNRDLETGSITAGKVSGEVKKRAFIVDDMISSGKTIVQAANVLKEKGVEDVYVFATHPVFSENASHILQKSPVEKVFVTDTIDIPKEKQFEKLEIISIAQLIAESYENSKSNTASY